MTTYDRTNVMRENVQPTVIDQICSQATDDGPSLHGEEGFTRIGKVQRESGLGIAAFVISVITLIGTFATFAVAGAIQLSTPSGMDEQSVEVVIGTTMFALMGATLLGMGLGLAGIEQTERVSTLAISGLVFNAITFLGIVAPIAVGASMQ